MATSEINENCHCVQNDPHRCKIKIEKFHFDILCYFGVNYLLKILETFTSCTPFQRGAEG